MRRLRDILRLHHAELEATDFNARYRRFVEINVVAQCIALYNTGTVQKTLVNSAKRGEQDFPMPRIHAIIFDPADGQLCKLPLSVPEVQANLGLIYNIYQLQGDISYSGALYEPEFEIVPGLKAVKVNCSSPPAEGSTVQTKAQKSCFESLFS